MTETGSQWLGHAMHRVTYVVFGPNETLERAECEDCDEVLMVWNEDGTELPDEADSYNRGRGK